jgi:2'-5' RNA ligase
MAYDPGQTGLVIVVPAAEPVVDRWRQRYDPAAPAGVPAHVTVLYPFLALDRIDESVTATLRDVLAARPAFELEFRRCGRFPDAIYLDPEPAEPCRRLTEAIAARWPEAPPYGGIFDAVVPHLTVAQTADEETLAGVERDVAGKLPVRSAVREIWLYAYDGSRWAAHTSFPLGSSSPLGPA